MIARHARILFASLALVSGCALLGGPNVAPTEFFVLNTPVAARGGPTSLSIGLGPLSFPDYLARPQMATRQDANHITYSETNRWAEPLKQNFARVLAGDLIQLTGAERVEIFPWYNTQHFDFTVDIAVARFEQQAHGEAQLVAHWTVRDRDNRALATRTTDLRQLADTPGESAAALSALTAQLAGEIAAALGR